MLTGAQKIRPSTVQAPNRLDGFTMSFQPSASAISVMSRKRPDSINSSAWRPWLNWNAPGGFPPVMRLTMTGRALSPPAIAPSIHVWPLAVNALANSATAAASPPDVHQCITSRSVAFATVALALTKAVAARSCFIRVTIFPPCLNRYRLTYNDSVLSCKMF